MRVINKLHSYIFQALFPPGEFVCAKRKFPVKKLDRFLLFRGEHVYNSPINHVAELLFSLRANKFAYSGKRVLYIGKIFSRALNFFLS
jgi:hypothetical protein